jgi:hypothetical protein
LTHFAIFPVKALTKQEGLQCLLGSCKNALVENENLVNCLLKTNWLIKLHLVKVGNFEKKMVHPYKRLASVALSGL